MAAADTPTSMSSGSGGGRGSIPCGTPVQTKADAHTALSLVTNHTTPSAPGTPQENADSAQSLLRDVHNESEKGSGSKRSVFQWRSRSSGGSRASGSSSGSVHGKHYAKMGLVMDSPTKQSSLSRSPRVTSDSMDILGGVSGEDGEYEVVQLEGEGGGVQASPPITVNSEPMANQGEGPTSSPDSGYGNTPDNPGGEEDHLTRVGPSSLVPGRARSGAISDDKRLREDTQDCVFGMDPSLGSDHTHHNRTSPTPCVSPVPGVGPANNTTPTSLQLASMDSRGSLQDSALVSASSSSTGDSKEVERERPFDTSLQSLPRQTSPQSSSRKANTYHKRLRVRTSSSKHQQLSKSTEVMRSSKSFNAASPPIDEKDYFQVTDELAQENSHFSLSEALLAVIEQYKATCLEQRILDEQLLSGSHIYRRHGASLIACDSSLSAPPPGHNSSLSAPPPGHDSSLSAPPPGHDSSPSAPPSGHDSSLSAPPPGHNSSPSAPGHDSSLSAPPPRHDSSLSAPPPGHNSSPSAPPSGHGSSPPAPPPGLYSSSFSCSPPTPHLLSSWGSLSSIATTDDATEGRSILGMTRVSLLELMQSQSCDHSAESTAQKLLQSMAGHRTENLKGISQLSIKLPTDFLLSLQTDEDLQKSVTTSSAHMRGSREWAPPRKQIIYHIKQPNRNLQAELAAQGHRCTGCGMKVDSAHSKFFRFCNYVGKYFCQNCHTNAAHIIPAYVLERWSFKKLPVSNFARDLLAKFQDEAVFSVNPEQHPVYRRVPVMGQAKEVRAQLVAIRQYLRTCRRASGLNQTFEGLAPWTTDLSSFSMNDFLELRAGLKLKQLRSVLLEAISHVKTCAVCQGKGFVCEFCQNSDDIIFPFEANKVSTCRDCRCCFHKECFAGSAKCPRCERIQERQKQRVRKIFMEAEEEEFGDEPTFVDPPG